ncbi:hypothetical protein Z517_04478 [Fonsecaea pedrosoi CBS 271.37]|uniref:Uncharacterized protein n=1 Tax=Fonsecaea pedrosoi CBS 271.37 TaxID=1442368 RepID=A0A0D2GKQ7_9EURO|nr:uncharacterized protein Z517_04478 [Fonsecaea pedrosoi CBS 271.37]KIW81453.1 hypothetical protein Z517_04478 [Fonsecaea pedrosoi CBS 271.37]
MAKDKSRKHANGKRHSSVTPQKSTRLTQDIVDLTKTDPWAHQARRARSVAAGAVPGSGSKLTPLSPAFGGRKVVDTGSAPRLQTTIEVPQDPKSNPTYIFQQLALSKNRANTQPSFYGAVGADDGEASSRSDATERDSTPTPGHTGTRDKTKPKKKRKSIEGNGREQLQDRGNEKRSAGTGKAQHQEKEARQREDKKKRKDEKKKKQPTNPTEVRPATTVESRKRKRNDEEAEAFKRRVEVEANAVKGLRESLPAVRLDRVSRRLEREEGIKPTEMAVLLVTSRETIIDLARQQVLQTERAQKTIQDELLRILKDQNQRLAELEGKTKSRAAPLLVKHAPEREVEVIDDTSSSSSSDDSSSDSDDDDDDDDESVQESHVGKKSNNPLPAQKPLDRCPTQ